MCSLLIQIKLRRNKMNGFYLLKIEHLEGGGHNIDTIIKAIQTFSTWALRVE